MTTSSIWGATDLVTATASMRLPADTSSSSSPGYLTVAELGTFVTGSAIAATGSVTDGKLLIGNTSTGGMALATLTAGTNITITNSAGGVTIAASGSVGTAFSALTSATNTTAAMVVGTGASLAASGSGTITATAVAVGGVTGLGTGVATFLATPSSANLLSALTDKTGTGVNVFATSPNLTTPTTGANAGTNGSLKFFGSTSGDVTVKAAAAAGTATIFQLPATNGTNTYVLQTDGAGVTSWAPQAAGLAPGSTQGAIQYNSGSSTFSGAVITGLVKGNGTAAPAAATAGTDYVAPGTVTAFTAQQYFSQATLTDASPITWNLNTQQAGKVTLTSGVGSTRQLQNPTNQQAGGTYTLIVVQSATGSNALTFGTNYKFPGGTAPTLSTANNAIDILTFISDGTNMYGVSQLAFA